MPKLPKIPYKKLERNNKEKSDCISLSERLRVLAKTTISFLVKDNYEVIESNLQSMEKIFRLIQNKRKSNPQLYTVAAIDAGLEEYLEALLLYNYIKNKPLPAIGRLNVLPETYLGALSDMTGELVRLARQNDNQAKEIHDYVARIYQLIIPISITRNSQMRTKLESIGHNLQKIEGIIYDLRLRDKI